jgi:Ca2+-binding EF-hand superfamily protein
MSIQFRNQKLRHLFRVFDVDADGGLTKVEFVGFAEKLADAIGHATPEALEQARNGQRFLWGALSEYAVRREAGGGEAGSLAFDEFRIWADALTRALPNGGAGWMARWSDPQFELMDVRGEGQLGIAEYAAWCEAYQLPGDPDRMFRQLDQDGDGLISKPEFLRLTLEFLASEDPDAAGNVLWGQM